jgi:hypothetical protein
MRLEQVDPDIKARMAESFLRLDELMKRLQGAGNNR